MSVAAESNIDKSGLMDANDGKWRAITQDKLWRENPELQKNYAQELNYLVELQSVNNRYPGTPALQDIYDTIYPV